MPDDQSKSFPVMPSRQWWALRKAFTRTIPNIVDGEYLATTLDMTADSARKNILPALRVIGIIDENGKPTDRAVKWRDDEHYKEVCEAIRKDVYPAALLDAVNDAASDREKARRWFARTTGSGESSCKKMANMYLLLCEADPSKSNGQSEGREGSSKLPTKERSGKSRRSGNSLAERPKEDSEREVMVSSARSPSLHLNIQIHISPDSTPEQIEQIFASMAKHLK